MEGKDINKILSFSIWHCVQKTREKKEEEHEADAKGKQGKCCFIEFYNKYSPVLERIQFLSEPVDEL